MTSFNKIIILPTVKVRHRDVKFAQARSMKRQNEESYRKKSLRRKTVFWRVGSKTLISVIFKRSTISLFWKKPFQTVDWIL